ncbi:MAG: NADH-quinone oxidoreductase subunit L [Bacteroidetes bacterium]|nr:NADH-quinone oxidoreductase subunit L [Bacteroidota bacterium]
MTHDAVLLLSIIILLTPLLSFLINVFFGGKLGKISGIIGTSILGIDFVMAIVVAFTKLVTYPDIHTIQTRFEWISLGPIKVVIGYGIDNIAAMMLIVVTLISFLVHLFSTEYMSDDRRYPKFYAYLGLFTFSMLGIVIANNFLLMYMFWELVGISSYLLIGFWYEKNSASNAGKKAFITNRIGDLGFFTGIMILYMTYGTFMFDEVFAGISSGVMPFNSPTFLTLAGIGIFLGAMGKSAQWPLHVWLPDAMEGPTPVSALIHAATMVAAGVYLVAKVFAMFTADALTFIAAIGTITAFVSATIAITQVDFKKVLAYSTVSQLGFMIMSLGVGGYTNGFFHLVTHAWFKAALFLAAGSVIHAMHHAMHHMHDHHTDPQDINNMGGLRKTMPWTYRTFLFVTLALSGVPLTSGFLSKDGLLAGTLAYANLTGGWHWIIPVMGFAAAGMTAFYMFRLTIVAFHGEPKTKIASHTHENKSVILIPLIVLSVLSLWFFYSPTPIDGSKGWVHRLVVQPASAVPAAYQWSFLLPEHAGEASPAMHAEGEGHEAAATEELHHEAQPAAHATTHAYLNKFQEESHHFHYIAMFLSVLIAGGAIGLAFMIYQYKVISADKLEARLKFLHTFSLNKWYFDELYQATVIAGTVALSKMLSWFDTYIVDGLVNLSAYITRGFSFITGLFDNHVIDGAVNLIANTTGFVGARLRKVQTGHIQTYLVFVLVGLLVLLYYFSINF